MSANGTPDLVAVLAAALERADQRAVETRRRLDDGEATTGRTGLQEIHEIASDALAEVEAEAGKA